MAQKKGRVNEYMRDYWKTHPEQYAKQKKRVAKNSKKWCETHKEQYNTEMRKRNVKSRSKVKIELFELLGNKCSNPNCLVANGCKDFRCLQIDHVNGGGQKEIESNHNSYRYYLKKIKNGSRDYQLLCANCNWIKRAEKKEYAHRYVT